MSISTGANPFRQKPPRPRKHMTSEEVEEQKPIHSTSGGGEARSPLPPGQSTIRTKSDQTVQKRCSEAIPESQNKPASPTK